MTARRRGSPKALAQATSPVPTPSSSTSVRLRMRVRMADRLLALGPKDLRFTGVDHTDSMPAQARTRLGDRARLRREDILDTSLPAAFDVAYSVGGVRYIVQEGEESWLSSHLTEEEDNAAGLANLAAAIRPGGSLLLSVQGPHRRYDRPLPGGLHHKVCPTPSRGNSIFRRLSKFCGRRVGACGQPKGGCVSDTRRGDGRGSSKRRANSCGRERNR
ncbi:class I SAM-dependent methyltransferase [Streptomyces sp. NPDC051000]|uniref:class I SAM-dependent methyltransferase n=1 Tax=Streptomyces sp. NPDC051000 TaxID=3155520 RepID=UPI0033CDB09B